MKTSIITVLSSCLIGFAAFAAEDGSLGAPADKDPFDELFDEFIREPTAEEKARAQKFVEAEQQAVAKLATTLKDVDRVQVFLLDPNIDPFSKISFPITPYSTYTAVRDQADVPDEMLPSLLHDLATSFVGANSGLSAMCHYPVHGIRCFRRKVVVFETSIAWTCNNFYASLDGQNQWIGFADAEKKDALMASIERLLPLDPAFKDPNWNPK